MPLVTRTGQVSFAPKGDKGDKGARMRMRVWEASVSYLEGKQGQQFYDIVLYDNLIMKLHELKPAEGSRKVRNRVGRGTSSGNGKTSGRGQKGQKARSGVGLRPGFEGGQTPLFRRLPKRGFTNINAKEYTLVNLDQLNVFEDGTEVTPVVLKEAGIIRAEKSGVKVLGNGELTKKLTVKAAKFSKSAEAAITAKGGSIEVI